MYVAFEGVDGAGKTTICNALLKKLQGKVFDVVYTREPGGTLLAEELRNLSFTAVDVDCKYRDDINAMLIAAGRLDHYQKVVEPALKAGKVVISDRSWISWMVYQFTLGNANPKLAEYFNQVADIKPNILVMVDAEDDVLNARKGIPEDNIERATVGKRDALRAAYREFTDNPNWLTIKVDGGKPIEENIEVIIDAIEYTYTCFIG